jgi:predicted RNA-binding protein with RPS1 domain
MEVVPADPTTQGVKGEFVSGIVYKIEADILSVRLSDGRLGQLQKHQCADFAANSDSFFLPSSGTGGKKAFYSIGSKIVNALVLAVTKKVLFLSLKPLLLLAAKNQEGEETISIPDKVADLLPGQVVAGYVLKVESFGVMVRFGDGLTALVPRPNVADRFVSSPEGLFNVGDSVRCVVQRLDLARERVIATFKSVVVNPSSGSSCFLKSYLREACLAGQLMAASEGKNLPAWKTFSLSSVLSATVSSVESYGVVLTGADQTTMMLARGVQSKPDGVKAGQVVKVLVLDIDFKNKVLDVSMDEELIAAATALSTLSSTAAVDKKKKKKGSSDLSSVLSALSVKGSVVKGRVELVQADGRYLVVSLSRGAIVFVMVADYHCPNPTLNAASEYTEHQEISVKVECVVGTEEEERETPHSSSAILSVFKEGNQRELAARALRESEVADPNRRLSGKSWLGYGLD